MSSSSISTLGIKDVPVLILILVIPNKPVSITLVSSATLFFMYGFSPFPKLITLSLG
jgi:hypothetical protein